MAKRIYITDSRLKKFAMGIGATGVPLAILLFWFLASLGGVTILDYSGNQICAGNLEDPCIASINFTANEDIFLYPGNWSGGLLLDKPVESVKMYRSWGKGWREIDLSTNCKGTWCGASDSSGNTAYSFAFREGRNYTIKYEVLKNNPKDSIKWTYYDADPYFFGVNNTYGTYENNDLKYIIKDKEYNVDIGTAELKSHSSVNEVLKVGLGNQVTMFYDFNFNELYEDGLGKVYFTNVRTGELVERDYRFVYWGEEEYQSPIYEKICEVSKEFINNTLDCSNEIVSYETKTRNAWLSYNSKDIPIGNIRIGIEVEVRQRDYIDGVWEIGGKKVDKHSEWVEYSSWATDFDINASIIDVGNYLIPSVFNGSFLGENTYWMISGSQSGYFYGFKWDGTDWNLNSTINGSIAQGRAVSPINVFYKDSSWYAIAGNIYGDGSTGYVWSGTEWVSNSTIINGLPALTTPNDIGGISTFQKDGTWYMITGSQSVAIWGWTWNGTSWIASDIEDGILNVTDGYGQPEVFTAGGEWYALVGYGEATANVTGYKWGGSNWVPNSDINKTLTPMTRNSPSVFFKDGETYAIIGTGDNGGYQGWNKPLGYILTITLQLPTDYANLTTPNINFQANVSEEESIGIKNVSILIDGVINSTNTSTIEGNYSFDVSGFTDGNYNWSVLAFDDGDVSYTSSTQYFLVDTLLPNITIDYPKNLTYSTNVSELNYSIIEVNPDKCWYSLDEGAINLSEQEPETNFTDVISSEGSNTWIVFCNDTCGQENNSRVTFFKDTINPLIEFESETESNATLLTQTFVYANVSVTETNEQNITFGIYWSNGTLVDSTFSETAIREKNWTNLEYGTYLYNVTVFDVAGNSNSTETRTIYLSEIYLFFDGVENDLHIELNTTINITGNSSTDFGLICLDIDHPEYGYNYSCSNQIVSINFTPNYFRKTTFWNDTTNWLFSDFNLTNGTTYFTNESLNFTAHQYDEIDSLSVNISGIGNIENPIFYGCNTSQIDRYYQGFLLGNEIYLNQSVDSGGTIFNNSNNITFNNQGNATIYFYLDDNATITNITMNVSSEPYGFSYFDEFDDFSNIDTTLSNAQLHYGSGGFIQSPNSSLSLRTFDDFNDGSIADHWVYDSSESGSGYSWGVREASGYLEAYTSMDQGYSGGATKAFYPYAEKMWFYTSDYLSFDVSAYYKATEGVDTEANCNGVNYVKFANQNIFASSHLNNENSDSEQSTSSLSFTLEKINNTHWRVNISGTEVLYTNWATDCDDIGAITKTYDYTNGLLTTVYDDVDCTDTSVALSNSTTYPIDENQVILEFVSYMNDATGCEGVGGTQTYLRLDNLKNKLWYRSNGSIVSNSIFDSANNIASATMNISALSDYGNYTFVRYLSADNGNHWESVSNGVEHTFNYPGKHIKYKVHFNTTNPGYQNATAYIENVTIETTPGNVSNLEFDFGNDGISDYVINGNFTSDNGTIPISMESADISDAISSTNRQTGYGHLYKIPLRIYSNTPGQLNLEGYNITYNPNPVIFNSTAIQDYLNTYGSNETNFSIVVAGANGTINVSDIKLDYAGGNDTINITVRGLLSTLTQTRWIYPYYSRWDYEFVPLYVNWLEFIPKKSNSLNVTPYGQTNSTAILNLTNYGYGDKNANLSVYLNDTSECVNLTLSTTWDKEDGYQLNNSWIELDSDMNYLKTNEIWMWADYNCSYNNWTLFNPSLYFRQCCDGCTCSGGLDY